MRPFALQEYHDNPELQRRVRAQALAAAAGVTHRLRHRLPWAARLG